jgi:ankyrin repeat protein
MNNHPANQCFTAILLFLNASLQSCIPPLKLGYEPFNNKKDKNAQELLHSSVYQAKYQPILIPAACLEQDLATAPRDVHRFTAASGEAVSFLQENGLWKARVNDGPKQLSSTRELPVIFQKSEAMLTLLPSLSKQKANIHKHHIHILNSDHGKHVFVGTVGLPGGMEEKEEADLVHHAIKSRRWKAIKNILATSRVGQVGIITRQDKQGNSPLHIAAQFGDVRVLRWLLYRLHNYAWEYGNDPNNISLIINTPNKQGKTALHLASIGGHRKVIKHLLRVNAAPNISDSDGYIPWQYADRHESGAELSRLLLQYSAPDLADSHGRTPLHQAALSGHLALVKALLARGANPNLADMHGRTPLHEAVLSGHLELAQALLARGAHPNLRDMHGRTPLHEAVISGHLELAQELLARGANSNLLDSDGYIPLHYAKQISMQNLFNEFMQEQKHTSQTTE